MIWLAPGFLAAGVLAALAVVALHLIALQRPRRYPLPTARFVPTAAARAAAITRRPSDWLLLLLRTLAVLALGAAFARPVLTPERRPLRQLLLVDRSDAVGEVEALRDSAIAHYAAGDAVILVDSVARAVGASPADSLRELTLVDGRGSLSAALVAARRMATALADSSDSLRIVVVSPFVSEAVDAALPEVRAGWPGSLTLVSVAARADTNTRRPVLLGEIGDDDPLAAGVHTAALEAAHPVRVIRFSPTTSDSSWARSGGLLVIWPTERPAGWRDRAPVDSVGAVVAGAATLVAPFARPWIAPDGLAVARWVDGEPAAVEQSLGDGCLRTVGVPLAEQGDLTLQPAFGAVLRALVVPCGGARELEPISSARLDALRGTGPAAVSLQDLRTEHERSPLTPWLLGLALLLLISEWAIRSTRGGRDAEADSWPDKSPSARDVGPSGRSRGVA